MAGAIKRCFAELRGRSEAALVPFIMAGDPDLETTRRFLQVARDAGADMVELGVPFSDPTADGPVLQRSAARALERGTSLPRILDLVAEVRSDLGLPVILFGYYNPIFRYGPARFAADASKAGVDGLLVVDLPPEEAAELWKPARAAGMDQIFLLAPTSDEGRVRKVLQKASGFIYYVSMTGVTGSKAITPADVRPMVEKLRVRCGLPVGVGFGITSPAEAASVASFADAVIVGSAIMRRVEDARSDAEKVAGVASFLDDLKQAMRGSSHRIGDGECTTT
jgi:tryptophan synthase alpha chain